MKDFTDFWPYYLSQHCRGITRVLHLIGTFGSVGLFIYLTLNTYQPVFYLAVPIVGYGMAWFSHFVFEKNRPATFRYPFWSLLADFCMAGLMCFEVVRWLLRRLKRTENHPT